MSVGMHFGEFYERSGATMPTCDDEMGHWVDYQPSYLELLRQIQSSSRISYLTSSLNSSKVGEGASKQESQGLLIGRMTMSRGIPILPG